LSRSISATKLPLKSILKVRPRQPALSSTPSIEFHPIQMQQSHSKLSLAPPAWPVSCRKKFAFNETVLVGETFSSEEYERKGDLKIQLTPTMAYLIRQELNQFKREMVVHEESRKFTHYYN
jgi:hypothetical protein